MFNIVIVLLQVLACLWVFPHIRERGASEPSQASRNDLLPQIAYSRSISGEGGGNMRGNF